MVTALVAAGAVVVGASASADVVVCGTVALDFGVIDVVGGTLVVVAGLLAEAALLVAGAALVGVVVC